ncbi:MAG: phenylacetic acid degradation protein [Flavobacteriales bacterium]|nr:MAG: phenylacetic acid degradation protein [Flavobacteriales bacterium]
MRKKNEKMAKFYKLKVTDVRRETDDCVSVAFDVPDELKDQYKYIQGQYLTLKFDFNGKEVRRSYSFCSSPATEKEIRIAAKKVSGGQVSTYLNDKANVGDELDVMTPMGNFHTELHPSNKKTYVLFAGGSGITPIISIIKTVLHVEPLSNLALFYANRDKSSIIFKDQLIDLAEANSGRLQIHHILDNNPEGEELLTGIITPEKAEALMETYLDEDATHDFFICGPSPMMKNVKDALEGLSVRSEKINIEYFTAVIEDIEKAEKAADETPVGNVLSNVTVVMDGDETTFELSTDGLAILDAAHDAGVDAPFSCKGAVCSTCRAKLMKGKVKMDMNYALTDSEVEDGYILTCQSHPITADVEVNYDEAY